MNRYLIPVILLMTAPAFAQTPAEKARKRLEELVAVGGSVQAEPAAHPLAWRRAKLVEVIEFATASVTPKLASLPSPERKKIFPPPLRESTPLTAFHDGSLVPGVVELPTQPLIWLPAVNVASPVPLPILSRPANDRASLGDPAFDISVDATMKAFSVVRDRPIPFSPINIPDPFENVRYGQLRNPPDENPTPVVVPWQKPM